jgi:surface protein
MSRRPACTPVGKDASKGRLQAVLAAGLAHHGRPRPAPTEVWPVARKAFKRTQEEIPPNILTAVPFELLQIILSYSKGMPCEKITELRLIDNSFDQLLQGEDFWKWQCKLRNYGREDRLFWDDKVHHYWTLPPPAPGTAKVPYHGSWRRHYEYWCRRQLDNRTLRAALNRKLDGRRPDWQPPHIHPNLGPIASWDVSQVTVMSYLFYRADRFTGDLSKWDVSNVTNMESMFFSAENFDSDLSKWIVSNVTNMVSMFDGAPSFKGDLSGWDVSNVTNMTHLFHGAAKFNADLSGWDVSNVTNMEGMFSSAFRFTGDLSTWKVSNVTNMTGMFSSAVLFTSNLSEWDVSSVEIMVNMFADARSFNGDISTWDVSNVTDMYGMFQSANIFNGNISNWDVSNVTVMERMFEDATSFNGDLSKWNVSNVYDTEDMFEGATSYNPDDGNGLGERAGAMEVGNGG